MRIHIDTSQLQELSRDFGKVPVLATHTVGQAVEKTAKQGNTEAGNFARGTARRHGKWYPSSMSAESAGLLSWVYGPVASRRQGGMSFEFGSRNQPPHLDLAKSADVIAPLFARRVAEAVGKALDGFEGG